MKTISRLAILLAVTSKVLCTTVSAEIADCPICPQRSFNSLGEARQHVSLQHPRLDKNAYFPLPASAYELNIGELSSIEAGPLYFCPQSYADQDSPRIALRDWDRELDLSSSGSKLKKTEQVTCPVCHNSFEDLYAARRHFIKDHPELRVSEHLPLPDLILPPYKQGSNNGFGVKDLQKKPKHLQPQPKPKR